MQLGGSEAIPPAETTVDKLLAAQGYAVHSASDAPGANGILDSQAAGKPFALTVRLAMPPESPAQKHLGQYEAAKFETLGPERSASVEDPVASLRRAAARITALDGDVQTIIAKLTQKNLRDSTLVIFTSSCGALLSHHGLWGAGEASNPVNFYDESIGTPMLWSWPGQVPTHGVRPEMVSSYDLLPSIAGMLSLDPPAGNRCGRSYALIARGKPLPKKEPWRTTVFAELKGSSAARVQRYKLVEHASAPSELYSLATDRGERTNQFENAQFDSVRASLTAELHQWKQRFSSV
jgi:arylsulfatase A-like enzyme